MCVASAMIHWCQSGDLPEMNNLNWTMRRNSSKYVLDHNAVDKCLQQIALCIRRELLLTQLVMEDFPLY